MSRKTAADSLPTILLEALEPRIAPAVLYAGPADDGGMKFDSTPVKPTDLAFTPAATVPVQTGDPSLNFGADQFSVDLKAGDSVQIFSDGWQPFIKVTAGRAIAFFSDKNNNDVPESNELTGLSLGAGSNVTVNGDVDGDVIANFDANFTNPGVTKKGAISTNDLISTKQTIAGFSVTGSVSGRIIAGGNVNLITVGNGVEQINTGTPGGAYTFDFGGTGSGIAEGKGTLATFDPGLRGAAGNISNIKVGSAEAIWAGDGGAGGKGGDIVNITVGADTNGLKIFAGAGGAGNALNTATGGMGGKVSQVLFKGVIDTTHDLIEIAGGDGGDTFVGSKSVAGNGGLVEKVYVGYDLAGTKYSGSPNLLKDSVIVSAGDGGDGSSAGNGGTVVNVNILAAPDFDVTLGDEIQVLGGNGGTLWASGTKAGLGGSVTTFNIQNMDAAAGGFSGTFVHGGDASASAMVAPVPGSAAGGGAVTGGTLLGSKFTFAAGDGSDTEAAGGAGGSISNLSFATSEAITLADLLVNAGDGGTTIKGAGGIGGDITGIVSPLAKISTFSLFAGDGGESLGSGTAGGLGGRGGNISKMGEITDSNTSVLAEFMVSAGDGGDGMRGGGLGGSISALGFFSSYASLEATAGNGGSATGTTGTGAAGGSISSVAFTTRTSGDLAQDVLIQAGAGGNAKGTSAAGAGGSITLANIQAVGNVRFEAGAGGQAETKGTTGAGGSLGSASAVSGLAGISRDGNVAYLAGDSGISVGSPTKGGNGGSIINVVAASNKDITFAAGDGRFGGNGGDLSRIVYYGVSADGLADPGSAPWGNILVEAGQGGAAPSATGSAGRGGNITTLTGYSADFNVGLFTSTALDSAGHQHIAYYDASLSNLNYAYFDGASWTITTVDQIGDVGQFASLDLTTANRPVISYYDATNGDLKLAKFDGAVWTTETVASAGNVGQFSSLELTAADLPRIVYFDQTEKDLEFASWSGSAWTLTTVDFGGDVGMYASLAYDAGNNTLHTSYYDETGGNLKYAASVGGGAWTAKTVDSVGNTGLHTSIAVNPLNSHVGISYFNQTAGSIRYAEGTSAGYFSGSMKFLVEGSAGNGPGQSTSVAFDTTTGDPSVGYAQFYGSTSSMYVMAAVTDPLTGNYDWSGDPVFVGSGGAYSSLAFDAAGNGFLSYHDGQAGSLKAAALGPIFPVSMTVSDKADATFTLNAGNGGNNGRAGNGGAITGVSIIGGEAEFSIVAGNGGSGDTAGGLGGSISSVAVLPDMVVRAIAAGDGGDTVNGKGANGGTINKVDVAGDIGFRSGKAYGFATDASLMGGLFAGRGGFNTTTPLDVKLFGTAGNVTNITAAAISSIVAGRAASPQLVGTVDGVFLRGLEKPIVNVLGGFSNFGTANLVGGKARNPLLPDADDFQLAGSSISPSDEAVSPWVLGTTSPIDGLIAALNLTTKRNFAPLAFLTNTAAKTTLPPVYSLLVPTVPLA